MPEPPGIVVYIGARLEGVRLTSLFVLRSVEPPIDTIVGRTVAGIQRLGKRMVIGRRPLGLPADGSQAKLPRLCPRKV